MDIVLTKSDKHTGYCVSRGDRNTGKWIHVVSSNAGTEHAMHTSAYIKRYYI